MKRIFILIIFILLFNNVIGDSNYTQKPFNKMNYTIDDKVDLSYKVNNEVSKWNLFSFILIISILFVALSFIGLKIWDEYGDDINELLEKYNKKF